MYYLHITIEMVHLSDYDKHLSEHVHDHWMVCHRILLPECIKERGWIRKTDEGQHIQFYYEKHNETTMIIADIDLGPHRAYIVYWDITKQVADASTSASKEISTRYKAAKKAKVNDEQV